MRAKIAVVLMCGILIAGILFGIPLEDRGAEGKDAIESALERIRRTGCFNHRDYPWVIWARRVRGDTLYFVDILYRNDDGRGFRWVGKAVQATLEYSDVRESVTFGCDTPAPPERRESLRIRVRQIDVDKLEGITMWLDDRSFDLPLPSLLPARGFRPFAEAEGRLVAGQREALGKDYPLKPEQRRLIAAFGEGGDDLLQTEASIGRSGRTVCAYEKSVEETRGRNCQFPLFAVARFDRSGRVSDRFRGRRIQVDWSEFYDFTDGDDTKCLSWTGEDGRASSLPASTREVPE